MINDELKEQIKEEIIIEYGDVILDEIEQRVESLIDKSLKKHIDTIKQQIIRDIMKLDNFFKCDKKHNSFVSNDIDEYTKSIRKNHERNIRDLDEFKHPPPLQSFPDSHSLPINQQIHQPPECISTCNPLEKNDNIIAKIKFKNPPFDQESDDNGEEHEFEFNVDTELDTYTYTDTFEEIGYEFEKEIGLINKPSYNQIFDTNGNYVPDG